MNIVIAAKLMELYAACPNCGCEVIGNGDALECDTAVGYFKRSCGCGWCVEVTEGIVEEALAEDPPELSAKKCTHTAPRKSCTAVSRTPFSPQSLFIQPKSEIPRR